MTPVTIPTFASVLANGTALVQPGNTMTAIVLAALDATTFQLQVKDGTVVVKSDVPLTPGTSVELAVEGNAKNPTLSLAPLPSPQQNISSGSANAATDAGHAPPLTIQTSDPALPKAVADLAANVLRDSAARQGGLAPLLADVEQLLGQSNAPLPKAVVGAMQQLLGGRLGLPGNAGADASDLKAALIRSGLATGAAGPNAAPVNSKPAGLTVALLSLRQSLKEWADQSQAAAPENVAAPETPAPPASSRAPNLAPPYRNAPTVGQAPVAPSVTGDEPPRALALHLLTETEAAIARQTLLKIASLPDAGNEDASSPEAARTRQTIDIPLATPQGNAVAQIRIERDRDARKDGSPEARPVWKASFSIDVESIGPVHVHIALAGARTVVKMNAERPETAGLLTSDLSDLAARLRAAQLEPADLHCNAVPRKPASAAPGLFTDLST